MPRLNGKFVSQAVYDLAQGQSENEEIVVSENETEYASAADTVEVPVVKERKSNPIVKANREYDRAKKIRERTEVKYAAALENLDKYGAAVTAAVKDENEAADRLTDALASLGVALAEPIPHVESVLEFGADE